MLILSLSTSAEAASSFVVGINSPPSRWARNEISMPLWSNIVYHNFRVQQLACVYLNIMLTKFPPSPEHPIIFAGLQCAMVITIIDGDTWDREYKIHAMYIPKG